MSIGLLKSSLAGLLALLLPASSSARAIARQIRGDERGCISVQHARLCNDPRGDVAFILNGVKLPLFDDYPIMNDAASLDYSPDRLTVIVGDLDEKGRPGANFASLVFVDVSRSPRAAVFTSRDNLECPGADSISTVTIDLVSGRYSARLVDSTKTFRGTIEGYRVDYRRTRFLDLFSVLNRALKSANLCAAKW